MKHCSRKERNLNLYRLNQTSPHSKGRWVVSKIISINVRFENIFLTNNVILDCVTNFELVSNVRTPFQTIAGIFTVSNYLDNLTATVKEVKKKHFKSIRQYHTFPLGIKVILGLCLNISFLSPGYYP